MADTERVFKIHPKRQRWTHLAFPVRDIDASIAWYEKFTHLELLTRREDELGYGAWLGDRTQADDPFLLVLAQFFDGKDPFAPVEHPPLGPFAHIGIEVLEREKIDEIAALAKEEGCLALGPEQMPPPVTGDY